MQFESSWPTILFILASCRIAPLPSENSVPEERASIPDVGWSDPNQENEILWIELPEGMDPEIAKLYKQALYEDFLIEMATAEGFSELPVWLAGQPDPHLRREHFQDSLHGHHLTYLAAPWYGEDYGYVLCRLDAGKDGDADVAVAATLLYEWPAKMSVHEVAAFASANVIGSMAGTGLDADFDGDVDLYRFVSGPDLVHEAEEQNEDAPSQQSLRFLGFRKAPLADAGHALNAFGKLVGFLGHHGFRVEEGENLLVGMTGAKAFGWLWYKAEKWHVTVSYELIVLRNKSSQDCYWRLTPHVRGTWGSKHRIFEESDFRETVSVSSLLRRRCMRGLCRAAKMD